MPTYTWLKYPFVRFAIAFLLGVVFADTFELSYYTYLLFSGFFVLIILFLRRSFFKNHGVIGMLTFLAILSLGGLRSELNEQDKWSSHFNKFDGTSFIGIVVSNPKLTAHGSHGVVEIKWINENGKWMGVNGKVQTYFPQVLQYGDVVSFRKVPVDVEKPYNPHQFDYKAYLANRNIFHQIYLADGDFEIIGKEEPSFFISTSLVVRNSAIQSLEKFSQISSSLPVAKALLLGERSSIPDELNQAYANAGVIHVLAVSGLHLGIVYGLLLVVFGQYQKKWWFVGLALFTLWSFAFIAGLPTSVMRAAFMFSVLVLGGFLQRKTNIYNTLFLSAMVLMILNPNVIFEVGFQLSYLAVLGIIISYAAISNLFYIKNRILDKVWSLVSVSFAAQLLTVPLLIYYFHNVSVLFFISNLLVVPLVTLVLVTGLLFFVVALLQFEVLASFISGVLDYLIVAMNKSVAWIETFPWSYVSGLTLDPGQLVLVYLIITSLILFIIQKKVKWLFVSTLSIVVYTSLSIFQMNERSNHKQLVVYRSPGTTILDYFDGYRLLTFEVEASPFQTNNHRIHMIGNGQVNKLAGVDLDLPAKLFLINGQRLILLQENPTFTESRIPIETDILVISNNALDDYNSFKFFDTPLVLLDSSNDFWYALKAEEFLNDLGIETVNIWNGAYIKIYN